MPREVAAANQMADVSVNALAVRFFDGTFSMTSVGKFVSPYVLRAAWSIEHGAKCKVICLYTRYALCPLLYAILAMACQPAVEICIFLLMTLDTLTHAPYFLRQPLKVLHLTVTFSTGNFAIDVALVIEQHMFGHIIYFYPGRGCIGVKVFVFFFYPGMIGNNIFVAVQAFFDRRYSGIIGIRHVGVAVLALDLFHPAVNIVAERDGLLRSNGALR